LYIKDIVFTFTFVRFVFSDEEEEEEKDGGDVVRSRRDADEVGVRGDEVELTTSTEM
jgi:hypothetical protein